MAESGLQPTVFFLAIFPFILSCPIVVLRVLKRWRDRRLALEDYLIVIAEILIFAFTITSCITISLSYTGYYPWKIPRGALNVHEARKWRFINAVIYNPIIGLIKISFLLTLIKLQSPNRYIRLALWSIMVLTFMTMISGPLIIIFECWPMEAHWDYTVGHCVDRRITILSGVSLALLTDVLVLFMPTWILYGLQIERRKKFQVIAFLSLGVAVTAIGAYRLASFVIVLNVSNGETESTHTIRPTLSNIECNLAAIAACGATIKWLLGLFIPYFDSSRDRPTYYNDPSFAYGSNRRKSRTRANNGRCDIDDEECITKSDVVVEMDPQTGRVYASSRAESTEPGITKTVDWNVDSSAAVKGPKPAVSVEAEPRAMV